jgi:hypothetical protein
MLDRLNLADKIFRNQINRRPYAFGLWLACLEADLLGLSKLSVFEFGVAHGHGLLNLCEICDLIHESTGFEFKLFGFDSDTGMPPLLDYRDHPEIWHEGEFLYDHAITRAKLPAYAELITGPIRETLPRFLATGVLKEYPVGFVSVDVDLYSSTCDLLKLFEVPDPEALLPATITYFDDINDMITLNSWCGEALAIREFNDRNPLRKLEEKRIRQNHAPEGWHDHIYCCHVLDHPDRNGRHRGKPLSINVTAM